MRKVFVLLTVLAVLFSCKKDQKQNEIGANVIQEFNMEKWPKKTVANAQASKILDGWTEYVDFQASFDRLFRIENSEDLALLIEDLIEKQKNLAESEYPTEFDKPHIKSRQVALKTFILKTKGSLEYRLDLQEPLIEMIDSFNALNNQFNVIVNNTFDAELILEGNDSSRRAISPEAANQ